MVLRKQSLGLLFVVSLVISALALLAAGCGTDNGTEAEAPPAGSGILSWQTVSPMPSPRAFAGAAVAGGKIYVAGGRDSTATDNGILNVLEEYDPAQAGGTWTAKAPMPSKRYGFAMASVGDKIYVLGGASKSALESTVLEYDPSANTWSQKAPLTTARYFNSATVVSGKIYVIGGYDANGNPLASVEVYDPVANSSSSRSPLPTARGDLAVTAISSTILVAGGNPNTINQFSPTADTYEFDTSGNAWQAKTPMLQARAEAGAAAIGGFAFICGGTTGQTVKSEVFRYKLDGGSWASSTPISKGRSGVSVVAVGETLYVIGGYVISGQNMHYVNWVEKGTFQ